MVRAAAHRLGTDRRVQVAFRLVVVLIAVSVGLITGKLALVGIGLGLTAMVFGLWSSQYQRSRSR